jgi:hypothetical protein
MNSKLEEARLLKDHAKLDIDRATRDRNNIDFERLREKALPRLEKAINLLEEEYRGIEDGQYKNDLRLELADCYGIKGGVYRRLSEGGDVKANLEEAAEMYKTGHFYEIDDSYNLSNSVVIPILIDPENLERKQPDIEQGLEKIEELVRGEKKYDYWAWTDLGLFNLLRNNYSTAKVAYEQATQLGARTQNYKSTLSVLEQLERTLKYATSPMAESVAQSISEIIGLLNEEKLKLSQ